jgi:hypothetical protein
LPQIMQKALALGLLLLAGVIGSPTSAAADASEASLADRLAQIRNDPALSSDPAVVESLEGLADAAPATALRAEARMVVAEAWLGRMHRPADALRVLRRVVADPAADSLTSRLAEHEIVDTLIAQDRIQEAADEARAHAEKLDARFVLQVHRLERRRALWTAALAELILFVTLAAFGLVRASRRRILSRALVALRAIAPAVLAFSAFVALVGGALASQFESGNAGPFLALGAVVAPIVLVARAWSAVGSTKAPARIGRGIVCAASAFAAAFVLLDACSPLYLEGFGL